MMKKLIKKNYFGQKYFFSNEILNKLKKLKLELNLDSQEINQILNLKDTNQSEFQEICNFLKTNSIFLQSNPNVLLKVINNNRDNAKNHII